MFKTELPPNKMNLTEKETGKTPLNHDLCQVAESFEKITQSNMHKIGAQGISKK